MACLAVKRQKVLIANRGEIAVRIAQTVRCLGMSPVAIYSAVDRDAAHVRACDEAYAIGPAEAARSYLNMDVIVDMAQRAGVDMVHPGYGFLSENPTFATRLRDAGLVFIGPPARAMQVMGNKTGARRAMQEAGVPIIPGSGAALATTPLGEAQAVQLASKMGYPVMLKAAAGGGGRGMRMVCEASELAKSLRAASSEAASAFGDGSIYMEKVVAQPRHVEIQVFCDAQGEAFFIGERECSLQRRHQKVIEEAPSVLVDAAMREQMGLVACRAAKAVDYRGAGTVEFLVDEQRNFYFLEMNTRLQVEHAVTEMCYGLDLVAAQIAVAQGEALGWRQEDLQPRGHAIEARLYAEDASQGFMPSPGTVEHVRWPTGCGLRIDAGVHAGCEVSRHYDPLMAKIIAWAPTRCLAIARLSLGLQLMEVHGITHNQTFLQAALQHPSFVSGSYTTQSIASMLQDASFLHPAATQTQLDLLVAAASIARWQQDRNDASARPVVAASTAWRTAPWRPQAGAT